MSEVAQSDGGVVGRTNGQASMPELALSRWWHGANLAAPLILNDGCAVTIVFRGRWSHGLGPDFQQAMITFDRRTIVEGDIEMHLRASDWLNHRHHLDPSYNNVELHVVLRDDAPPTRRADGKLVPTLIVPESDVRMFAESEHQVDWSIVGGESCAEEIANSDPEALVAILRQLGDKRLLEKVQAFEVRCNEVAPAQALYESVMDSLGYSANREPMRQVAALMPLRTLEQLCAFGDPELSQLTAEALLLGVAGYLPLVPSHADLLGYRHARIAAIERLWQERGQAWHSMHLNPGAWSLKRVRPANHPVARLSAAAAIMSDGKGGLVQSMRELVGNADPIATLAKGATIEGHHRLGAERASAIVTNVLLPFMLSLSQGQENDAAIADQAAGLWEFLPAVESNAITRRAMRQVAGRHRLSKVGIRGQQGLLYLDRELCTPRRCFECPVAHLVVLGEDIETRDARSDLDRKKTPG